MSELPGCGCGNYWGNFPRSVCGDWGEPLVKDEGVCSPRRIKIDNAAPELPVAQCADDQFEVIYQPENLENPFAVIARIFDECCLLITDENGDPILTTLDRLGGYPAGTCA